MGGTGTHRGLGGEAPPLLGRALAGRYRLEQCIGHGAVSIVFRATDLEREREVAVKVLVAPAESSDRYADRLEREAQLLGRISHPCIVRLYEHGSDDGFHFIAMELLGGTTLGVRLGRAGRLPVEEAVGIVCQMADAVDAIHAQGFLHRDLKPGNVFVETDAEGVERVKLIDLGFARRLSTADGGNADLPGAPGHDLLGPRGTGIHTVRGVVFGSPVYMSPEQAMGHELDERSDVYALGIIAYELLSGRPPFHEDSVTRLLARHVATPPEPLQTHAPDVPERVAEVVLRALSKHPTDRPASALQLAQELQLALAASTYVDDDAVELPYHSRRGPGLAALALFGLAALAVGAWLVLAPTHDEGSGARARAPSSAPSAPPVPAPTLRVTPANSTAGPVVAPVDEASARPRPARRAHASNTRPRERAKPAPRSSAGYRIEDLKTPKW